MEWQLISAVNVDRRLEAVVIIVGLRRTYCSLSYAQAIMRSGSDDHFAICIGTLSARGYPTRLLLKYHDVELRKEQHE
eukprot:scaffold202582_cov46-Attheya_sp.AAC.5